LISLNLINLLFAQIPSSQRYFTSTEVSVHFVFTDFSFPTL